MLGENEAEEIALIEREAVLDRAIAMAHCSLEEILKIRANVDAKLKQVEQILGSLLAKKLLLKAVTNAKTT